MSKNLDNYFLEERDRKDLQKRYGRFNSELVKTKG